MEAPEKIYVDSKAIGDNISTTVRTLPQDYPTCTEYIRADAFIEKAVRWLNEHMIDYMEFDGYGGCLDAFHDAKMVEDFKNYMKGE